ncbi:MAG: pyrroline-5-carboxylate reductase [Clostridiales bacterium]|nr:pyrroline-5-carboxylate reductase [Candidatus Crickella merdequi]
MDNRDIRIGFIGFGSMASAICDGLLIKQAAAPGNISACARNWDKLQTNCNSRGIKACRTSQEVAEASDIVVIGVLPQTVPEIMEELGDKLKGKLILSIAYGVGCDRFTEIAPEGCNHISTVPNTPVSVGEGIFVCESRHTLTDEQLELFKEVFGRIALLEFVEPKLLDLGGIVAGSTPAFMAQIAEGLADAAVKHGMSRAASYRIVEQMMMGTAKYMLDGDMHPAVLKDGVCSPGGATIKGVSKLEECGIRSAMIEAVDAIMN